MLKETSVFTSYGIMPLIESSCNKDINYTSETLEVDEALLPEVCPLGTYTTIHETTLFLQNVN